jgi:MFS family permease
MTSLAKATAAAGSLGPAHAPPVLTPSMININRSARLSGSRACVHGELAEPGADAGEALDGDAMGGAAVAFALFLAIGLNSPYWTAMLPTFVLAGIAFALAYGPLNIAATNGIAPEEQGLAGGLVNTSFQFGGALVLAVVAAVNGAATGDDGSPQALLDGFHAVFVVPLIVAVLGIAATAIHVRRPAPAPVESEQILADISD